MYRAIILVVLVAAAPFCLVAASQEDSANSSDSSDSSENSKPNITCGCHETAYPCGTRCELSCEQSQPGHCVGTKCPGYECRCDTGHVRGPNKHCILAKDCPVKCGKGEIAASCGAECQTTCADPKTPEACYLVDCNPNARKQCRCKYEDGWVKDEKTSECVQPEDCS